VPNPPVIQSVSLVENAPGTIKLVIELPSTNTDGSPLAIGELVRLRVKYGPASNDLRYQNDFPPGAEVSFAPGISGVVYLAAQVQDSHGNWSALSSVVQSPSIPSIQESLSFWAHRLNADAIFTNNSPSAGYVSWSNVKLSFRNETWEIQDGNTNKRYIWWDYSQSKTTFQTSDDPPSLDLEDVLVAVNIDGTCYLYMYRPMIAADFLRVGTLQSANWSANAGSQFSLNDGVFKLGGSASPKLSWDGSTLQVNGVIKATQGSWLGSQNAVQISSSGIDVGGSGHIRGGATGFNAGSGFWLGYDATAYKFFVGSSTADKITWDGASLTVYGTIQAKSGGWIGASNAVQISSQGLDVGSAGRIRGGATGYNQGTGFWLGYDGTAYKFFVGRADGNKLTWDGSTLTVYGTIQAVGGFLGSSSALSILSGGLDVGSAGYIRGGTTGYNQGAGFWMGYDGTTYKFFIGNAAGNRLTWDGSSLTVFGTIQAASGFLGSSSGVVIESTGVNVGSAGYVRGGKSSYGTGSGFWLGFSGGYYKFDIGDASRYMRWDGSNLYVTGQIRGQAGSNFVTGTAPRADIGYTYAHHIALFSSTGSIAAYLYPATFKLYDGAYEAAELSSFQPQLDLDPPGQSAIRAKTDFLISGHGSFLHLRAPYGVIKLSSSSGEGIRIDFEVVMPYSSSFYWRYQGPTYGGAFYSPAGGIYVKIGGNRYAIPYYGPV
jgi:hypothetical protein